MFGSDHCPVYIDLHDEIQAGGQTIYLRDVMNPVDRPPSTAPKFPSDVPRVAPEPPRFATKFFDEFSGKQRTLKSLWANAKPKPMVVTKTSRSTSPVPSVIHEPPDPPSTRSASTDNVQLSSTLGIARAAFSKLDTLATRKVEDASSKPATQSSSSQKRSISIDVTADDEHKEEAGVKRPKRTPGKQFSNGQMKLASFFSQSAANPKPTQSSALRADSLPRTLSSHKAATPPSTPVAASTEDVPDTDQDALIAIAMAEADDERERNRAAKIEEAAPVWSEIFAKKIPPKCKVHGRPCKDFSMSTRMACADRFLSCQARG